MGAINVRRLDEETLARLKRRATLYDCSLEETIQRILKDALKDDLTPEENKEKQQKFLALSNKLRSYTRGTCQTPSEVIIREMRDAVDPLD